MIYAYSAQAEGPYHIEHKIGCQDACEIKKCSDGMVIAAVADGVGSSKHADDASKIAADVSIRYCAEHITSSSDSANILEAIEASFSLAQNAIEKKARDNGHSIDEYDTTLTLAVLRNDTLYYGQAGDSGIVALTTEGLYEQVTEQQRDEEDRVFCLFFKEKWVFGQHEKKVSSALLATDGIFDLLFPVYIENEPVNIHVALARFFMDNRQLRINESGEDVVAKRMNDYILNIPKDITNDDKTVVVLINTSIESSLQPEDYYKEPNWTELKRKYREEYKRKAYPHLFKESDMFVEKNPETADEPAASTDSGNKSEGSMDSIHQGQIQHYSGIKTPNPAERVVSNTNASALLLSAYQNRAWHVGSKIFVAAIALIVFIAGLNVIKNLTQASVRQESVRLTPVGEVVSYTPKVDESKNVAGQKPAASIEQALSTDRQFQNDLKLAVVAVGQAAATAKQIQVDFELALNAVEYANDQATDNQITASIEHDAFTGEQAAYTDEQVTANLEQAVAAVKQAAVAAKQVQADFELAQSAVENLYQRLSRLIVKSVEVLPNKNGGLK